MSKEGKKKVPIVKIIMQGEISLLQSSEMILESEITSIVMVGRQYLLRDVFTTLGFIYLSPVQTDTHIPNNVNMHTLPDTPTDRKYTSSFLYN